jgi:hypothetical protein
LGGRGFVSALDTPPDVADEIEALFREARQRRRRRWVAGALILLVVLASAAVGIAVARSGSHSPRPAHVRAGLPEWSAQPGSRIAPPAEFVTGDNKGGIGVYSTASGKLVRELSAQTNGGPDQQPAPSAGGSSVYFVRPQGACAASIQTIPISGSQQSVTAVSVPGTIALDPAPSPDSGVLAWVGSVCGSVGAQPTLYLSNQATGQRSDLGPYTGRPNDNGIAWSHDGALLAVEAAPIVKVLDARDLSKPAQLLTVRPGCMLTDPVFASFNDQLAVIRTCFATSSEQGSSDVVIYSAKTGHALALAAKAPQEVNFQSLSIDPSGHVLVGLSPINGSAETALLNRGRLVTISDQAPTGAQWITAGRT